MSRTCAKLPALSLELGTGSGEQKWPLCCFLLALPSFQPDYPMEKTAHFLKANAKTNMQLTASNILIHECTL